MLTYLSNLAKSIEINEETKGILLVDHFERSNNNKK